MTDLARVSWYVVDSEPRNIYAATEHPVFDGLALDQPVALCFDNDVAEYIVAIHNAIVAVRNSAGDPTGGCDK